MILKSSRTEGGIFRRHSISFGWRLLRSSRDKVVARELARIRHDKPACNCHCFSLIADLRRPPCKSGRASGTTIAGRSVFRLSPDS
jgi:hypothetical protein